MDVIHLIKRYTKSGLLSFDMEVLTNYQLTFNLQSCKIKE